MRLAAAAGILALVVAGPACEKGGGGEPEAPSKATVAAEANPALQASVAAKATVAPGAPADSLRDAVLTGIRRYYDDLSARDWSAFEAHFWPGATITTVWQPSGEDRPRVVIQTVREFVEKAPQGPDSKPICEERLRDAEVKAAGTLAQMWTRYDARFGDPGEVAEWKGTDAFTLLAHDGEWRIAALVFAAD